MVWVEVVSLIAIIILLLATFIHWKFNYWKRKNIPFYRPKFSYESIKNPLSRKQSLAEWSQMLYHKFKECNVKYAGLYMLSLPIYFPISVDAIKDVMQNDFQYFMNRGGYFNEKDDPLSAHLFAIGGHKWRNLRTKLTPTFTSGKIKTMFNTIVKCINPMEETMESLCLDNEPVIIKDVVARFATDIIGSCAFGIECDSFKSEDAAFRYHGQKVFQLIGMNAFKRILAFVKPNWAKTLGITLLPRDSTEFFINVVKDTITYRKKNNIERKDMLQLIMELQQDNEQKDHSKLTIEEIAAQAFVFFLAGFETSSTTMTFCLYELASNIEFQNKVREEINCVLMKYGGEITYDAILDMKYLDQVVAETLRKYPALPTLTRQCVKDYQIPGTNVVIQKNTRVLIPVFALHRDPSYFEDPEKFDPDRFSENNKANIRPFTYLPFGEGPRICIGMRFGMLQTKVGLAYLLKNYSFSVNSRTKSLAFHKYSVVLTTESPIWLNIHKLA